MKFGLDINLGAFDVTNRSFVSRYFALVLDQASAFKYAGFVRSVEGGAIKSEVTKQEAGSSPVRAKGIGLPSYESFTAQIGMSMSKDVYQWIEKSWAGDVQRMNGAFLAMDTNQKVRYEQWFREALITETTIPTLDGSSKEPGYMTVKFTPELSGHTMIPRAPSVRASFNKEQKQWSPSNFRLVLGNLPTKRVAKIDSFTIKQGTKRLEVGGERSYQLEPTNLEYPNLSVYFSLTDAKPWFDWHESFVIKGNNDSQFEKEGCIHFLSPKGDELLDIELKGVGIYGITVDKGDASTDSIKRAKAELYVEEMKFIYKG